MKYHLRLVPIGKSDSNLYILFYLLIEFILKSKFKLIIHAYQIKVLSFGYIPSHHQDVKFQNSLIEVMQIKKKTSSQHNQLSPLLTMSWVPQYKFSSFTLFVETFENMRS